MTQPDRWRIDYVSGTWRSVCGPDYENESEYSVVDVTTGKTVLVFEEYGDWPYLANTTYSGTAKVEISPDGTHIIVTDHDGSSKTVPLPPVPESQ